MTYDPTSRVDPQERVPGLTETRLAQLRADMRLTPEARVRAAQETLALDRALGEQIDRRVIGFDRYEDYLDYKAKALRVRE